MQARGCLAFICAVIACAGVWAAGAATLEPPALDSSECDAALRVYLSRDLDSVRLDAPIKAGSAENAGDTLLFFMHIPRTGGRNAMLCLLQQAFAPSRRCLRSYDRLRLERGCELVSTHDDLSSAAEASRDRHGLAVVTTLRDPVDRVISAYEMAVDSGSAQVMRDLKDAAPSEPPSSGSGRHTGRLPMPVSSIWPWSTLTPWMAEEMRKRARADLLLSAQLRDQHTYGVFNPYDNPAYPSLSEFIESHEASETVHDAQVFQILGLTPQSRFAEADVLRRCARDSPWHGEALLALAEARLRSLAAVGVAERSAESWAALAAAVGADLEQPGYLASSVGVTYEGVGEGDDARQWWLTDEEMRHGEPLGVSAQACSIAGRRKERDVRVQSLKNLFTHHLRTTPHLEAPDAGSRGRHVSAQVRQRIADLNPLDTRLHAAASRMLDDRLAELRTAGALPSFPSLTDDEAEAAVRRAREATERLQLLGRVRRQESSVELAEGSPGHTEFAAYLTGASGDGRGGEGGGGDGAAEVQEALWEAMRLANLAREL